VALDISMNTDIPSGEHRVDVRSARFDGETFCGLPHWFDYHLRQDVLNGTLDVRLVAHGVGEQPLILVSTGLFCARI